MAGVKGMKGGGGRRKGAGSLPHVRQVSDKTRRAFIRELNRKKRETGIDWIGQLVAMAYDTSVQDAVRLGALKEIRDVMCPKVSLKDVNVEQTITHTSPVILPVMEDDPAQIDDAADPVEEEVH